MWFRIFTLRYKFIIIFTHSTGQTTILLSSLNLQINKHHYDALEIHGSFQLEKHKPSDRVSGAVKLSLFLHTPEKGYLEECLRGKEGEKEKEVEGSDEQVSKKSRVEESVVVDATVETVTTDTR